METDFLIPCMREDLGKEVFIRNMGHTVTEAAK